MAYTSIATTSFTKRTDRVEVARVAALRTILVVGDDDSLLSESFRSLDAGDLPSQRFGLESTDRLRRLRIGAPPAHAGGSPQISWCTLTGLVLT